MYNRSHYNVLGCISTLEASEAVCDTLCLSCNYRIYEVCGLRQSLLSHRDGRGSISGLWYCVKGSEMVFRCRSLGLVLRCWRIALVCNRLCSHLLRIGCATEAKLCFLSILPDEVGLNRTVRRALSGRPENGWQSSCGGGGRQGIRWNKGWLMELLRRVSQNGRTGCRLEQLSHQRAAGG